MFIASSRTKIHINFLLIFNCTFSVFLALEKDFKTFRQFIETKKTSLSVAADKGDLAFYKFLLCDGAITGSPARREHRYRKFMKHMFWSNLLMFFRAFVAKINDSNKTTFLGSF